MKMIALVVAAVLVGAVALPPAFSDDDHTKKSGDKKFQFDDFSNKTHPFGGFSNETDFGDIISDFVHKRNELEKNQREEILAAIKDCREQVKNAENKTSAMQQCRVEIKSLSAQFKSELSQLQAEFKQLHLGLSLDKIQTPDKNKQILYNIINNLSHKQLSAHSENSKSGQKHQLER